MSKRALLASSFLILPSAAAAEVAVVTDILPVQSLVSSITQTLPEVMTAPGADPHHYALRPSDVRRLDDADLVVWMGPDMTPWLGDALSSLDDRPATLMLLGLTEAGHDHDEDKGHDDGHGHDDHDRDEHGHDDHGHDDHDHDEHGHDDHGHDDHDHDEHGHDEHGHDDHDHDHHDHDANAHQWLNIHAVQNWVEPITDALIAVDEANALEYAAQAEALSAELTALEAELQTILAPHEGAALIVLHDAYGPFLDSFGLSVAAALRPSDNTASSAARVRAAEQAIADQGVTCVFSEPNHDAALVANLAEDFGLRLGQLDPLGSEIEQGPGHYAATLRAMAQSIDTCLSGEG